MFVLLINMMGEKVYCGSAIIVIRTVQENKITIRQKVEGVDPSSDSLSNNSRGPQVLGKKWSVRLEKVDEVDPSSR